ncbi:MAG: hypothetical protein ACYDCN_16435 [Bacteroidia bacterium]
MKATYKNENKTWTIITGICTILAGILAWVQIYNQKNIMDYINIFLNHAGIILFFIGVIIIAALKIKWKFDEYKQDLLSQVKRQPV